MRFGKPMTAWSGSSPTDETTVLRAAGMGVAAVEGDPALEKLTTAADFARAEQWLACRLISAHRHGLRRPRLLRRGPGHARRHRGAAFARPRRAQRRRRRAPRDHRRFARRRAGSATSASISRRPIRNGRARRPIAFSPMRSSCSGRRERSSIMWIVRSSRRSRRWGHIAPQCAHGSRRSPAGARSGEHQGDDDRGARLYRPARRHCRSGGGQHSHGSAAVTDTLLPDAWSTRRARWSRPIARPAAASRSPKAAPAGWSARR